MLRPMPSRAEAPKRALRSVRCPACNGRLFDAELPARIEVKCRRCSGIVLVDGARVRMQMETQCSG